MMLEEQHVLGAICDGSHSSNNIIRAGCITHLSVSKLAYTEVHPKCRSCRYAYREQSLYELQSCKPQSRSNEVLAHHRSYR